MAQLLNSIIGCQNIGSGSAGTANLGFGENSLTSLTSGNCNTAFGINSLKLVTTGCKNTAVGYRALCTHTSQSFNVGIGYKAGFNNNACGNIHLGYKSYQNSSNVYAVNNIFIGNCSGRGGVSGDAVAIGHRALETGSNFDQVTVIGCQAINPGQYSVQIGACTNGTDYINQTLIGDKRRSSGICNIAIGSNPNNNMNSGAKSIAIGTSTTALCNKQIIIGDNIQNSSGDYHIQWGNSTNSVLNCIWPTWAALSDQRDKANIQSLDPRYGIQFIKKLKPKSFYWDYRENYVKKCGFEFGQKDSTLEGSEENYGFIAQEIKETLNELNIKFDALGDKNDNAYKLIYSGFLAPIVSTIQEISKRLDILDIELTQLEIA